MLQSCFENSLNSGLFFCTLATNKKKKKTPWPFSVSQLYQLLSALKRAVWERTIWPLFNASSLDICEYKLGLCSWCALCSREMTCSNLCLAWGDSSWLGGNHIIPQVSLRRSVIRLICPGPSYKILNENVDMSGKVNMDFFIILILNNGYHNQFLSNQHFEKFLINILLISYRS